MVVKIRTSTPFARESALTFRKYITMKTRKNPLFEKYYHFDLPPSQRKEFEEKLNNNPTLQKEYENYKISKNVEFELIKKDLEANDLSTTRYETTQSSIAKDAVDLLDAIETLQLFAQAYEEKLSTAEKRGFDILLKSDDKLNRQYILYREMAEALTSAKGNQPNMTDLCAAELKKIKSQPAQPANYQEEDSPRNHIILFFITQLFTLLTSTIFPPNLFPAI